MTEKGRGRLRPPFPREPSLGDEKRKRTTETTPSIVIEDVVGQIDGEGVRRHLLVMEYSRAPIMELELHVERKRLIYRYGRLDELDNEKARKRSVVLMPIAPGPRWTFSCPSEGCGDLVKKLYLHEGQLHCRRCAGVVYRSQFLTPYERKKRRRQKLTKRLGPVDDETGLPSRPKGMHQWTYERALDELAEVDEVVLAILERNASYLTRVGLGHLSLYFDDPEERVYPDFKRTRKPRGDVEPDEAEAEAPTADWSREHWLSWDQKPQTTLQAKLRNLMVEASERSSEPRD